MSHLSERISLPVYSINESKQIGIVENILFEKCKLKYYLIYNEEEDIKYLLNPKNVYGVSSSAITIKNMSLLFQYESEEKSIENMYNPINSILISSMGETFGKINDIEIENNKIVRIIADEIFPSEKILTMGENLIILKSKENEKISYFKQRKNAFYTEKDIKASIQNTVAPLREVVNNNMLLGRKTTNDIVGLNGEIIVKANTTINNNVINKVKYSGKLRELTLYSK